MPVHTHHPKSPPPMPCRSCGVETVVWLERTIIGKVESLKWHCLRCHARWAAAGEFAAESIRSNAGIEPARAQVKAS